MFLTVTKWYNFLATHSFESLHTEAVLLSYSPIAGSKGRLSSTIGCLRAIQYCGSQATAVPFCYVELKCGTPLIREII